QAKVAQREKPRELAVPPRIVQIKLRTPPPRRAVLRPAGSCCRGRASHQLNFYNRWRIDRFILASTRRVPALVRVLADAILDSAARSEKELACEFQRKDPWMY